MSHRHHHRAAADEKAKKLARKLELRMFLIPCAVVVVVWLLVVGLTVGRGDGGGV